MPDPLTGRPGNLDTAVDAAVAALRRVSQTADREAAWDLHTITEQMVSDLLDAWERAE